MFSGLVKRRFMLLPIVSCPVAGDSQLIDESTTARGYRVARYRLALEAVPADFCADPDGSWTFEALADAAGFASQAGVAIGALRESFRGHPEGAAVVTLNAESRPYVAIVECPIAYTLVAEAEHASSSAA
jgi:hypothetical protein